MHSGDTFAHYEIIEPIGRGAMGEVFSARDTRLGREVAVKVLPADFATDPERLARFRREAKVLAALNHTNIAAIHGLEEDQGKLYLAMELAPGETLEAHIDRGAMPTEDALAVAVQIAAGLEEAHAKGIVHRDLKPANVKLSEDGRIKILDFGLARAYQDEEEAAADPCTSPTMTAAMTQAGVILGTAAYMSPEQARGLEVDDSSPARPPPIPWLWFCAAIWSGTCCRSTCRPACDVYCNGACSATSANACITSLTHASCLKKFSMMEPPSTNRPPGASRRRVPVL